MKGVFKLFKAINEPWLRNKSAKAKLDKIKGRANKFFTGEQQDILNSPWGVSRMQQLAREKNEGTDPFHTIHVDSLEDAVACYESVEAHSGQCFAGPSVSRSFTEQFVIREVLSEGREEKTADELLQPVIRLISEQDATWIKNKKWQGP